MFKYSYWYSYITCKHSISKQILDILSYYVNTTIGWAVQKFGLVVQYNWVSWTKTWTSCPRIWRSWLIFICVGWLLGELSWYQGGSVTEINKKQLRVWSDSINHKDKFTIKNQFLTHFNRNLKSIVFFNKWL